MNFLVRDIILVGNSSEFVNFRIFYTIKQIVIFDWQLLQITGTFFDFHLLAKCLCMRKAFLLGLYQITLLLGVQYNEH